MPVRPAAGETVKTTTLTEILPTGQSGSNERLEIWDQVDLLVAATDPSNPDYEFTIYRGTKAQRATEKEWLGKFYERMSREKIQQMFGGGHFNVWLKMRVGKGNALELKYNEDLKIGGEPKSPASTSSNGTPAALSNDPIIRLIDSMDRRFAAIEAKLDGTKGIDLDAIRQALALNGQVFATALPAVTGALSTITQPHAAQPSPMDELQKQLFQAMIAKLLNPTDPIETFAKMAAAVKALPGFGGPDSKTGIALELVRQIPTVTTTLVQGLQAWQLAEEARARSAAIVHGAPRPIQINQVPGAPPVPPDVQRQNAAVSTVPEVIQPPPQADAVAASQAIGANVPPMAIETLEQMLCNIIADTTSSTEDAAVEACSLIERSMPGMTDRMISQGEEWLLGLFRTRPVLQQVAEHPRLPEFVKAFIRIVKNAPTLQPPNLNAPVA